MDAGLIERMESGAEHGASALFAAAVGYAAYGFVGTTEVEPQLALGAAGAGALAYWSCSRLLRLAGRRRNVRFAIRDFPVQEFHFIASEELLLTDRVAPEELLLTERLAPDELLLSDADRVEPDAPMVLDDILADGSDARVVRLFDRKAMPLPAPTPGQLQSRIANRLKDGASLSAPSDMAGSSDASQALSAALAELRRSLR